MKYIITDKNEIRVGINTFHQILAEGCEGRVVRAGHCFKDKEGIYSVSGESIGYNIKAQPEDAIILNTTPHFINKPMD